MWLLKMNFKCFVKYMRGIVGKESIDSTVREVTQNPKTGREH